MAHMTNMGRAGGGLSGSEESLNSSDTLGSVTTLEDAGSTSTLDTVTEEMGGVNRLPLGREPSNTLEQTACLMRNESLGIVDYFVSDLFVLGHPFERAIKRRISKIEENYGR